MINRTTSIATIILLILVIGIGIAKANPQQPQFSPNETPQFSLDEPFTPQPVSPRRARMSLPNFVAPPAFGGPTNPVFYAPDDPGFSMPFVNFRPVGGMPAFTQQGRTPNMFPVTERPADNPMPYFPTA